MVAWWLLPVAFALGVGAGIGLLVLSFWVDCWREAPRTDALRVPKRVLCDCAPDGPCAKKCDGAPMSAALASLRAGGDVAAPAPAPAPFIDPADVYGLHV